MCVASACGGTQGETGAPGAGAEAAPSGAGDPYGDVDRHEDVECFDFSVWRDAQDAYENNSLDHLDEDGDGGACDELAQMEHDSGWSVGHSEACTAIFADSPDGFLYYADVRYEESDCAAADPGPNEWDFSTSVDEQPEAEGLRDGWNTACEVMFTEVVGDDLYWGDDEVWVSQADCELASPY